MDVDLESLATSGMPKTPSEPKSPSPSSTNGSDEGSAPSCCAGSPIVPARKVSVTSPHWWPQPTPPWSGFSMTAVAVFVSSSASPAPSSTRSSCHPKVLATGSARCCVPSDVDSSRPQLRSRTRSLDDGSRNRVGSGWKGALNVEVTNCACRTAGRGSAAPGLVCRWAEQCCAGQRCAHRGVLAGPVAGADQPDHLPGLVVQQQREHLRGAQQRQLVQLRLHDRGVGNVLRHRPVRRRRWPTPQTSPPT